MPKKWSNSKERILVRDLQSVEVSSGFYTEKTKPLPPVDEIFVVQKKEITATVFEKKDSIQAFTLPVEKSKPSKFSPAIIQAGSAAVTQKKEAELLLVAEEMPRFPGCEMNEIPQNEKQKCAEEKLLKYIQKNITYPPVAMSQGIQGIVYIQFVVEKNGSISEVKTMRDIGGGCGKEAQRVVEMMPAWMAGKQGGYPMRVQFNLPVKFSLTQSQYQMNTVLR